MSRSQAARLLLVAAIFLLLQACALDAATSGRVVVRDRDVAADMRIGSHDRGLIEKYYRDAAKTKRPSSLGTPGERLPAGLAKGNRLPAGLQGHALPGDLEAALSPLPRPYARLVIGRDIVLVNQGSRVIADIMPLPQ